MKNIQSVSDSYLCSNCGACSAICSKGAISFQKNEIGRYYAVVNNNCIDCGLCQKVCPSIDYYGLHSIHDDRFVGSIIKTYIGRATNDVIFRNAQSGGAATALLTYLFDKGLIDAAVVCKMEYGPTPQVVPFIAENAKQLLQSQRSCYTPVVLLSVLEQIKEKKSVAVVGLPCHIQGIVALQNTSKRYDNIKYKIGLVCDRTECETLQDVITSFTDFSESKISWRRKYLSDKNKYDYKSAPIEVVERSGRIAVLPRHYRIHLKEMFTAPRCRVCCDKINVFSDIVLGDPWRLKDSDFVKGDSLVLTRTDVGQSLIEEVLNAGYLTLRDLNDNTSVLRSQLIDSRKVHTVASSKAFIEVIHPSVDSYLLQQEGFADNSEVANAKDAIEEFLNNESKNKREIIAVARKRLESMPAKKQTSIVSKIINRIKRVIK